MKTLDIDWEELELAFREVSDTENHLDLKNGRVVSIVPGLDDENELRNHVRLHRGHFALIQPLTLKQATAIVAEFSAGLSPGHVTDQIQASLQGAGAFSSALRILRADKRLWNQYGRHEQEAFWRHLGAFLTQHGIRPKTPPPQMELFADVA
jgi:hypothetical protein